MARDSQTADVTAGRKFQGLKLIYQHMTNITNGDTVDFGVKVVYSAFDADTASDQVATFQTGSVVTLAHGGVNLDGAIIAWVADYTA